MNQTDPTAVIARIRQMADYWEQHLPEVIRTPAVVSALRAALEPAAASAVVAPPTDRALRDRIADGLRNSRRNGLGGMTEAEAIAHMADAVLAVLPEPGRAATLLWAADRYETILASAASEHSADPRYYQGVHDVILGLRRLAVEAHDTGTQQPEAPDELATARATNQRLNYEKQRLESELAAYRRAVSQWEVSEHGTYVPLRTIAAIARAAGRDIETPQWLLHYQRVEQAEAAIDRVRQLHDRLAEETDLTSPDDSITRGAAAKRIATALDGWTPPAPVAQQPAPLRAELKPWQLLADAPAEPLPQTERVIGGRRLATSEQQAAAADGEETRS